MITPKKLIHIIDQLSQHSSGIFISELMTDIIPDQERSGSKFRTECTQLAIPEEKKPLFLDDYWQCCRCYFHKTRYELTCGITLMILLTVCGLVPTIVELILVFHSNFTDTERMMLYCGIVQLGGSICGAGVNGSTMRGKKCGCDSTDCNVYYSNKCSNVLPIGYIVMYPWMITMIIWSAVNLGLCFVTRSNNIISNILLAILLSSVSLLVSIGSFVIGLAYDCTCDC